MTVRDRNFGLRLETWFIAVLRTCTALSGVLSLPWSVYDSSDRITVPEREERTCCRDW